MHSTLLRGLRAGAVAGLMLGLTAAAQARVNWSVDLNLGLPLFGGYGPVYAQPYGNYGNYGGYVSAVPAGSVSVQVGGGRYWRHGGMWYRPWGPRWVVVAPPLVLPLVQQAAPEPALALPVAPSRPDPVIYPRNGQDAQQTEFDRVECNRWATTQPAALADASVFHRAVEACMDGRGYSMK